jgi:beta-lactamase class A
VYCCLFVLLLVLSTPFASALESSISSTEFTSKISALEKKSSGRIGVSVISINGASLFSYRENERFAMCSTFKVLLGALVLSRVDSKLESLDRLITFQATDILDYAPITKKYLATGHMTVSELIAASIQYSDNTAANLLLGTVGGPNALTKYLRGIGDNITRLDRNEPSLNTNLSDDLRDTSTPSAMAHTLQKVLIGDYLSSASKEQLKIWMFGNATGESKLRAGFEKFWVVGDKTGSGENGASNDVAIVFPRGYPPFIIAVFYTGSGASSETKSAVIAEVARITSGVLDK